MLSCQFLLYLLILPFMKLILMVPQLFCSSSIRSVPKNYSGPKQNLRSRASRDSFSTLFSYLPLLLPTHHHHSYALFTNNILIGFNHSLCNLKHFSFLIVSPTKISKSTSFLLRIWSDEQFS